MTTPTQSIPMHDSPDSASVAGRIAPPKLPDAPPPLPRQIPIDDPRWVLAIATHQRMTGSTLRPDARARLLKTGRTMGLNTFQCNLVIAVVQDAARRGRGPAGAIDGLLVIPGPAPAVTGWSRVIGWVAALVIGEAAVLYWLLG